jgi:hypothetical protein
MWTSRSEAIGAPHPKRIAELRNHQIARDKEDTEIVTLRVGVAYCWGD